MKTSEDYAAARHVMLDFGGRQKSVVEVALEEAGLSRSVVLAVSNAQSLAWMIRGTDIVATMQSRLGKSIFKTLAQCPLPLPMPAITYDLVWHRRVENSGRNIWLRKQVALLRDATG